MDKAKQKDIVYLFIDKYKINKREIYLQHCELIVHTKKMFLENYFQTKRENYWWTQYTNIKRLSRCISKRQMKFYVLQNSEQCMYV